MKPDHTSGNNINEYKEQPYIKWYDKWIKLHIRQIFEKLFSPVQ